MTDGNDPVPSEPTPASPVPAGGEPGRVEAEVQPRVRAEAPRPRAARPRPRSTTAASCLLGALGLLAFGGLGLCLITASFGGGGLGGSLMEETVSADEGAQRKILLIEYEGVIAQRVGGGLFDIGYDLVERMRRQLKQASEDDGVAAVVLVLDTPGGTVTASDRIWRLIKEFRRQTGKKVVLHMGGVCASGGYYIAAAADTITCEPTTITGSIGVVLSGLNFHDLLREYGVKDVTIASGTNKALLNPTSPVQEQHLAILQGMVDDAYERFITLVAEGRPLELEEVRPLADGRIYTANQALQLKLVDSIGYREDAIAAAKRLANLTAARVVRYKRPPSLADALAGNVRAPALRVDQAFVDEMRTPRLMAIWRP